MDTSSSENWAFLLKLLNDDPERLSHDNGNLFKHQQAYALALFLVDATLATPELSRYNVAALIAGELSWPCSESSDLYSSTQHSLAFFEVGGFVSFPGGWVEVHCAKHQQVKQLDQSIEDILRVTKLLQNICFGWKGYVQPHFVMDEAQLIALISKELGSIHLERLFPGAVQQCGKVAIYPEKHQFTQLESAYLWQSLLKRHSPEKAFRQWLLCVRVLSHSIVPVQFSLLEENEIDQFLRQVVLMVETAPEFSYPLRTIYKQAVNSYDFERLIQPVTLKINLHIGSGSVISDKTDESVEPAQLTMRTAETLDVAYHFPEIEDPAEIITLGQLQYWGNWCDPLAAWSWLIQECFNYVILIDHHSLTTKPFALNLLSLAESRQALKFLLFIILPLRFSCKYILFLLSRPETSEIAIYHLTNREYPLPVIRLHGLSDDLSQLFLDVLVREYVRTIRNRSDNGLKLLNVSLYLADNSGLYKLLNTDSFQYRALTCFVHKLEDKHVAEIASAFLETIPLQYERRISQIRERSIYLLGLWLVQRLASTDLAYRDLQSQLGECLIRFYSNAFAECIATGRRDLKSDNFFALLPCQSLMKVIGINAILRISSRYDSWASVLTYKNDRCFDAVSAIRQYLQLLILISKGPLEEEERSRAWLRIINIVCALAFGHDEDRYYLFSADLNDEAAELWKMFSLFVNNLPPSKYDEFTERCISMIPLDVVHNGLLIVPLSRLRSWI